MSKNSSTDIQTSSALCWNRSFTRRTGALLTHNHGLLAYWFNRFLNRKTGKNIHPVFIIAGAVLPDIFLISDFLFHSDLLLLAAKFFHSVPIFCIFFLGFIIGQKLTYNRRMAFSGGWGIFHIAIDMMTHKSRAWPYFWPWLNYPIHGIADYGNPILLWLEVILTIFILSRLLISTFRHFFPTQKTP